MADRYTTAEREHLYFIARQLLGTLPAPEVMIWKDPKVRDACSKISEKIGRTPHAVLHQICRVHHRGGMEANISFDTILESVLSALKIGLITEEAAAEVITAHHNKVETVFK